jgi:hypothetical protein
MSGVMPGLITLLELLSWSSSWLCFRALSNSAIIARDRARRKRDCSIKEAVSESIKVSLLQTPGKKEEGSFKETFEKVESMSTARQYQAAQT